MNHVEFWLIGYPAYVAEYIEKMKSDGKIHLTDFEIECTVIADKMKQHIPYGMEFQYLWSVKAHLEECIRWYKE